MTLSDSLPVLLESSRQVYEELRRQRCRLVLAESCTGGLLAAAMASHPGVSEVFCGSAVTYRNETKACWLEVSRESLNDPALGAVSHEVAEEMCLGVLRRTPEADFAAAITGHLGPAAPPELDGVVYVSVLRRGEDRPSVRREVLETPGGDSIRERRRLAAAQLVFSILLEKLTGPSLTEPSSPG